MNAILHPNEYHVLIVEDDADERQTLAQLLAKAGYRVSTADSTDKALSYQGEGVHFVLTDLQMGDLSGIDLLKYWKTKSPETMFLMITGKGSTESAVEAIKAGAYHYMTKPVDFNALLVMIQNMIKQREDSQQMAILQNRLDEKFGLSNIIGRSQKMEVVFELIRRSAQAFSTVLILGESGTGKELVAAAIHQNSPRRSGPFIAVNCAAMPASLVESELFGHEKGAFTGAVERRVGRFEQAHGGTLFIDEIGDFDVSLQVKLLRVMENRTVTSVGGTKEIKVDTRVVAATSRNMREMIANGQFREDLYYRLNVVTIELPPLRERLDDIPLLVKRFMDRVNAQNGSHVTGINPDVIDALQGYHWPGNVRELLNVVERMIVLSDSETLELSDLPAYIRKAGHGAGTGTATEKSSVMEGNGTATEPVRRSAEVGVTRTGGLTGNSAEAERRLMPENTSLEQFLANTTLEELENMAIGAALRRFHNHRTRAARALGISVRTLQRKLGTQLAVPGETGTDTAETSEGMREHLASSEKQG